jgi:glycosyltransferase involved in cell wall biosynthesis
MSISPFFSIIIPMYSSEKTINHCLDSVKSSMNFKYEIIIVDDHSKNKTNILIKKKNIKYYLLKKNMGAAYARNFGASKAKGKYLVFLDSDVMLHKVTLDNFYKLFKKNNQIKILQASYDNSKYENLSTQYIQSYFHYYLLLKNKKYAGSLVSACVSIEKKLFFKSGGFDLNYKSANVEDEELGYRLKKMKQKIFISNKLQVKHLVSYSLPQLIKRNFKQFSGLMILYQKTSIKNKINQKNFINIFFNILLVHLIIIILGIYFLIDTSFFASSLLILCGIFILSNLNFLSFVIKTHGFRNILILPIIFLDRLIMIASMYNGIIYYRLKKLKEIFIF